MEYLLRVRSVALVAIPLLVTACGGSVEPSSEDPTPNASAAPPSHGSAPADVDQAPDTTAPVKPSAAACQVRPREGMSPYDSCDVARESMTLEVRGITWLEPALAWKEGARGELNIRYQNASDVDSINYPGVTTASSDSRARTDIEAHGDSFVHPDLYALSPCMVYDARHGFTVVSSVPSGTKLTFAVSAAVGTGEGIGSCGGTLPTAVVSFTAP